MRFFRLQFLTLALSLLAITAFVVSSTAPSAHAQTITSGALSGVVSDSTGAVVPGAKVTVTNVATDAKQVVVTNAEGRYTLSLLKPGAYQVTASAAGLKSQTIQITVLLGTTATGDILVTPSGNTTVVEVSAGALPLVDTENVALATTLNTQQIQDLPTPGGDVTTVAFTAPGVTVNAGGAYGNFSSDGLPGISNMFILNGFDNMDPFLNLNNSGSSNLTLGQGELADATVIQNAYNSQYGRMAGAIVSYTTKSGGNAFHGEAMENYNGTVLNANGWFNNYADQPRPHAVSNEWALNGGGPIVRNKLFFFSDWEGLHYVLPASGYVSLPTTQFQSYAIANSPAASQPLMTTMMNLYKNSPAFPSATASPVSASQDGGCGSLDGTMAPGGGFFGAYPSGVSSGTLVPCTMSSYANANNINIEWLYTQRIDWDVSDKQKIWARFKMDHGSQPTYTSFINPVFDAVSVQPEYEGQMNDTYSFSPNLVNSAVIAANWYTAFFGSLNPQAASAALPFFGLTDLGYDGSGTSQVAGLSLLGLPDAFPQGRNVTQYQLEDDVSWTHGKHTLGFGVNFRRDLITDFDQEQVTQFPEFAILGLGDLAQGVICGPNSVFCGYNEFAQAFITSSDAHLALYNVGFYVQDDWQVLPSLKLTIGARVDRTGDPFCTHGCFSLYQGTFPNSNASLTTPYSSLVNAVNGHPFSVEPFYFQPRFGFNYEIAQKTVVRGGVGYFADLYPAGFLDGAIQNFPNYNFENIYGGNFALSGAGSMYANASAANAAAQTGFTSGNVTTTDTALYNAGVPYSPPNINAEFNGTFHEPTYVEFSLQIQHQFTRYDGLAVTYAGNYGYNEIIQDPFLNASSGEFSGEANGTSTATPTAGWISAGPIGGLGVTPPDPSFSEVNGYSNNAHSNYNGATIEYTHIGQGLTGHLAYTWSHALDEISNGGEGEDYNSDSVIKQVTPSLGAGNLNYSNADYDIRNDLVGDLIYAEPYKAQNPILNYVVSGWTAGVKTYYRSGQPYSITNNGVISGYPTMDALGGDSLMPQVSTFNLTDTCASNPHGAVAAPCLDISQYGTGTGFGNLRRNAIFGPHYADTDFNLNKKFYQRESMAFELGAQAYNVFNHPNFNFPGNSIGAQSSFGTISSVVAPPTSPYGSFQSAAVTQRVLVVTGTFTF